MDETNPPQDDPGAGLPAAGRYEILVRGHLAQRWAAWFDGLTLDRLGDGTTRIAGAVPDQAALHGVLQKVRDTGLPLLSVELVGAAAGTAGRSPEGRAS
jgi:hypothetical protein